MSNRTPRSTPNRRAITPSTSTELTGAPATIHTQLTSRTTDATVTELATAAGIGRSTTSKALVVLEERGLAVRTHGGHDGALRTPDRWRAAPTQNTDTPDAPNTGTQTPHDSSQETPQDENTDHSENDLPALTPGSTDDLTASTNAPTPKDDTEAEQPTNTPAASPAPASSGETRRLAPGELKQQVIDYLKAHPGEAFTATKISRAIVRSSGAIANSLATLTKTGITQQVSDTPRTFQLADAQPNRK